MTVTATRPAAADLSPDDLSRMANAVRALAMDGVEAAKSGHPGMPMGMADAATALFTHFVTVDPAHPLWPNRDRFVLSAGHGSMLIYALSHLLGYEGLPIEQLKRFRQMGSRTPGHPEIDPEIGVEMTTGPLGQGVSTAVGMALAERVLNARFGDGLINHYTYVIASDGDLQEGVSHEACALAGHLKLGRLVVLWDDNHISIDGSTELSFTEDVKARFAAYGWDVSAVDGHDPAAVIAAVAAARRTDRPSLIACRTIIGKGAPNKADSHGVHGSPLGADEIAATRAALNWPYAPFEVPAEILAQWRAVAAANGQAYAAWKQTYDGADADLRAAFDTAMANELPANLGEMINAFKEKASTDKPAWATRVASGNVLEVLVPAVAALIGGSADLTPSNNTRTKGVTDVQAGAYGGRYIRYGIREHGMATIMNGMAIHGGLIPYAGTFMQFADYSRPAIRLAALMKQRVVHVLTHDSIGLGEDGPTHQPVEHLAALRAIPNLLVFRPADGVETAECWALALENRGGPSALALTRQNLPTLRTVHTTENLSAKGAYVLYEATGKRKVTLLASGSEVSIAAEARAALEAEGIGTALVSMPCWELFEAQDDDYRDEVLGRKTVRVGIEAAARMGWDRWIGKKGAFIGMPGFGESAPYQELYQHFGITADAVVKAAKARL